MSLGFLLQPPLQSGNQQKINCDRLINQNEALWYREHLWHVQKDKCKCTDG